MDVCLTLGFRMCLYSFDVREVIRGNIMMSEIILAVETNTDDILNMNMEADTDD